MLTVLISGCSSSHQNGDAEVHPNVNGGGNPVLEAMLDGCPNAGVIRAAVSKAQDALGQPIFQVRLAPAAAASFLTCVKKTRAKPTRDWAAVNLAYWVAHSAVPDRSGVATLDTAIKILNQVADKTQFDQIRSGALTMRDSFKADQDHLMRSLAAEPPSPSSPPT